MKLRALAACLAALAMLSPARAGEFGVSPIRIDLDRATRSSVLTVSNDGATPLGFQIRAFEWTQGPDGADVYEPTNDLVYFPQQLRIPANENRVVRIGYRNPALEQEKAYRVFVEEQVERPAGATGTAAAVAVAVRFGVPVFLRPPATEQRGELAQVSIEARRAGATVRNPGTVHFRINSVRIEGLGAGGERTFEHVLDGWYLLAGAQRRYTAPVPDAQCRATARVRVEVIADKLRFESQAPVDPGSCS